MSNSAEYLHARRLPEIVKTQLTQKIIEELEGRNWNSLSGADKISTPPRAMDDVKMPVVRTCLQGMPVAFGMNTGGGVGFSPPGLPANGGRLNQGEVHERSSGRCFTMDGCYLGRYLGISVT
jgi:hypothetical protein